MADEAFRRLIAAIRERSGTVQPTKSKAYATAAVKREMAAAGHTLPHGVVWGTNTDADGNASFGLVMAGSPVGESQFILNHVTSVV